MNFIRKKISTKIIILCVLVGVLICAAICTSGFFQYRNAIYQDYQTFAYNIANVAASYVDGDTIQDALENGGTNPEYIAMRDNLYKLYKNSGISSVYIAIPDKDNLVNGHETITNLFDVHIVEATEETRPYYEIGVVDEIKVEHPEYVFDVFYTGEINKDYFVTESKFGYNTNSVLSIKNSAGEAQAILVVSVPMNDIKKTLNGFVVSTILLTVAIIALFIGAFVILLNKTVSSPIKAIAAEAENFTNSNAEPSDNLLKIKQIDEIGHLAKSIYKMENDINTYIDNLTAITAEKERIGAELSIATHIQTSMLPYTFPAFPERTEIDIYATMNAAKEVGGDFYDFFFVDDRHLAIVMADVSGKGVPAALFMVIGKTLIKDHTVSGTTLSNVFTEVNNLLCESNSQGLFITAFEGVLDLVTGEFTYVNAGHEMPFVYKQGEKFEAYKIKPGFVLAGMEDMRFKAGSFTINPGDKIFQYTDGVTEATDAHNELFGMDRLDVSLNKVKNENPQVILTQVKSDIDEFVGEAPQFDDITMLCVEFKEYMKEENQSEQ